MTQLTTIQPSIPQRIRNIRDRVRVELGQPSAAELVDMGTRDAMSDQRDHLPKRSSGSAYTWRTAGWSEVPDTYEFAYEVQQWGNE